MKALYKPGQPVFVLWFDDDINEWDIDGTSIFAADVPIVREYAIIQADLPKTSRNLIFVKYSELFPDIISAQAQAAKLNERAARKRG